MKSSYSLIALAAIAVSLSMTTGCSKFFNNETTEPGLVFHCTFDDEQALEKPRKGPAVKLELGKILQDKGKNYGCLFVKPGIAGAEIKLPAGTFAKEGCIEFWANMASGKTEFTTGGDPRFFVMLDGKGSEFGCFEFASNNGGGNSGLWARFFGMTVFSNRGWSHMMPYSDVFKGEDFNDWHHYALVWTPTSLQIFIDGKRLCKSSGRLNVNDITTSEVIFDIPLNRKTGKSFNNKSAFKMDDLKIWDYAKQDFVIH